MAQDFHKTFHKPLLSGRDLGRAECPGQEKQCPKKTHVQNLFENRRFAFEKQPSPGASCAKRKRIGEGNPIFRHALGPPRAGAGSMKQKPRAQRGEKIDFEVIWCKIWRRKRPAQNPSEEASQTHCACKWLLFIPSRAFCH